MSIYSQQDLTAIRAQRNKRLIALGVPCALLLAILVYSLTARIEWLTSGSTILIGVLLIAGYDFAIKPLLCYEKHLKNCLYGRTRECTLPFVRLCEAEDLVDGVPCRQLLCSDVDGKGRPYDRLFYFDAQKTLPDVQAGDPLLIVHHDLFIADLRKA